MYNPINKYQINVQYFINTAVPQPTVPQYSCCAMIRHPAADHSYSAIDEALRLSIGTKGFFEQA